MTLVFGRFFNSPPTMPKKVVGDYKSGTKEDIFTLLLKLIVDHTIPKSKTRVFYKDIKGTVLK